MAREFSVAAAIPAAIAAVGVGATVVALEFAAIAFVPPEGHPPAWTLVAAWAGACIVFMLGFLVLGIPAWLLAHYFKRRHWYDALLIGAILTGGTYFLWALPSSGFSYSGGGVDYVIDGHYTRAGLINAIGIAAEISIAGAAAGLTIWWIAYRPRKKRSSNLTGV